MPLLIIIQLYEARFLGLGTNQAHVPEQNIPELQKPIKTPVS